MSGAFALVNVLADAVGPGTMGLKHGTEYFFIISASTTLCFILLHTFWGIIFFAALDKRNWVQIIWVIGSHLSVSFMTLLNIEQLFAISLSFGYTILIINAILAFKVAGGKIVNITQCFIRN